MRVPPLSSSGRLSVMLSSTSKTRSSRLPIQYKRSTGNAEGLDIDVFPPKKGGGKRKGGVSNGMRVQKVSSYSHCIIESASHGPFLWNSYARIMKDCVG
ncbi:hypothetical protein MKW92_029227 [Papaver armeniacum]|nr:hypothetical protein MKW92_029227 [Papaver armeniacum]